MLARPQLKHGRKYHGAYLGGFPERARSLLNASIYEPVLHVCGGCAKYYPYRGGFGEFDKTLDLDIGTEPDFLQDARDEYPKGFKAILVDPPYDAEQAAHYRVGASKLPSPSIILKRGIEALEIGGRVGIIGWSAPRPLSNTKFIAAIAVLSGFNQRIRIYSVYEKPGEPDAGSGNQNGKQSYMFQCDDEGK